MEKKVLREVSRRPARPGGLVEISGKEGQTVTLKCRFLLISFNVKMRKHKYFEVPQLKRYNLDHSRLGGSRDHSETGEETECSCRPGHNRSLQVN